jgi:hypothetical protein
MMEVEEHQAEEDAENLEVDFIPIEKVSFYSF